MCNVHTLFVQRMGPTHPMAVPTAVPPPLANPSPPPLIPVPVAPIAPPEEAEEGPEPFLIYREPIPNICVYEVVYDMAKVEGEEGIHYHRV